jgi:hypothetical protein
VGKQRPLEDGKCRNPEGQEIECQRNGGWAGADGCYYGPADPSTKAIAARSGQPSGPGAWYTRTCYSEYGTAENAWASVVWRTTPPVTPEAVAWRAVSQLMLPDVVVRLNPAGDQLVNLPTWLTVDASSWRAQSATASVPGVSVTATATPMKAVWSMGDGATVVCSGPGTPWRAGMDPAAASPDCGHRYTRSSAHAPGEAYSVTVRVEWQVVWAGAGRSGTVPGLTTTGSVRLRVAESQALVTR